MNTARPGHSFRFGWLACAILLPVVLLAMFGATSLRQDYLLTVEKARDRARGLADAAAQRVWSTLRLNAAPYRQRSIQAGSAQPLFAAVGGGHREIAALLLARGAKVNRLEGTTGWPPLLLAIERLDPAMVELLLRNGADPNLAPRSGESLLVLAKSNFANLGTFTTPPVDLMSPRMDDAKPQAAQAIIDLLIKHGAKEPQ